MIPRFGQRGSAMIETLIAAPIAALVITTGSSLLYLSFAKAWLARSAREGAVCLVTPTSRSACRLKLRRTLEIGLPFGKIEIEKFHEDRSGSEVETSLRFDDRWVRLSGGRPMSEPLRAKARMPHFH